MLAKARVTERHTASFVKSPSTPVSEDYTLVYSLPKFFIGCASAALTP